MANKLTRLLSEGALAGADAVNYAAGQVKDGHSICGATKREADPGGGSRLWSVAR